MYIYLEQCFSNPPASFKKHVVNLYSSRPFGYTRRLRRSRRENKPARAVVPGDRTSEGVGAELGVGMGMASRAFFLLQDILRKRKQDFIKMCRTHAFRSLHPSVVERPQSGKPTRCRNR